jgi:hypothetical protein
MTGGTLNLASTQGTGDDILSMNPQITFFKKVYKRHTNFGLETIECSNSTNSSVNFGESVTYTIEKSGTLINDMHIEFTLPPAINSEGNRGDTTIELAQEGGVNLVGVVNNWQNYCCWVNAIGYAILNEVKLEIDGNTIDKHTGLWYDIWNELTDPMRKEWSLVGKRDDNNNKLIQRLKSRYYVPLKFYFNRNAGLSFPIFLLDDNKVKVNFTLNALEKLVSFEMKPNTTPAINTSAEITNFKFFTTYVFLDAAEENRIRTNLPNEYLVETTTVNENMSSNNLSKVILNNPVKELIWVIRHKDRLGTPDFTTDPKKIPKNNILNTKNDNTINNKNPNDAFNYTLHLENTNLGYGSFDTFRTLKIVISNKDRIKDTDATFFRTIQPYKHHSNVPGGINGNENRKYIYSYSFSLNPEEYQPSGSYNFTKADDFLKLEFTGIGNPTADTNDFTNYRVDLFAFHYKYLSVYDGRIVFKDVPYSSNIQTETIADSPAMKGVEAAIVKDLVKKKCRERTDEAIVEEEKRLIAIEEEVRRRYATKKPDVHRHQNFSKKKWSGLAGQTKE